MSNLKNKLKIDLYIDLIDYQISLCVPANSIRLNVFACLCNIYMRKMSKIGKKIHSLYQ